MWLISEVALRFSSILSALTILTLSFAQLSVYLRASQSEESFPLPLTIDALLFLVCLAIAIDAFRVRSRARRSLAVMKQSVA